MRFLRALLFVSIVAVLGSCATKEEGIVGVWSKHQTGDYSGANEELIMGIDEDGSFVLTSKIYDKDMIFNKHASFSRPGVYTLTESVLSVKYDNGMEVDYEYLLVGDTLKFRDMRGERVLNYLRKRK